MTTDFGRSLSCVSDLQPDFAVVTGRRLLAEAIVRRITTPRGRLIDDPNYGIDVREWLLDSVTPSDLQRLPAVVDAEIQQDERIVGSTTTAIYNAGVLTLSITLDPGESPFTLTLAVSELTVELLSVTP